MATPQTSSHRVRFGTFEANLRTGELRKQGARVKLQEQPFQVLAMLLERPGEIVTREELRERLWPADVFVDFDQSLNKAINKIREALNDSADSSRFVETLARRGYRFIAPVEICAEARVPSQSSTEGLARTSGTLLSKVRRCVRFVIRRGWPVPAAVLLLAVLAVWLSTPPPRILGSTQLTRDGRIKECSFNLAIMRRELRLVTDGFQIYFTEAVESEASVAQVSVSGGETVLLPRVAQVSVRGGETVLLPRSLPDTHAEGVLDFSPLRNSLLVGGAEWSLWEMPLPSGQRRRLGGVLAHDAKWSPDAKQLAFAKGRSLFLADADGGAPRKLAELEGEPFLLAWSPDGGRLRFSLYNSTHNTTAIWEMDTHTARSGRLFRDSHSQEWSGQWTPNGKYFVFTSSSGNRSWNLWALREGQATPVQLTKGGLSYWSPYPSPDGKKIFAVGELPRAEVARYDIASRHFLPYTPVLSADCLDFSSDGQWVCYVSYPDGLLWRSRVDGSQRLQLSMPPTKIYLPRWSPDRKQIVFMGKTEDTPWKIRLVSAEGGTAENLLPGKCPEADPNWSPDGTRIVYAPYPWDLEGSSCESGILVLDLQTKQVSKVPGGEGFFSPRWSPDGKSIAALGNRNGELVLFDFATSHWSKLADAALFPTWSRDGKYVYFFWWAGMLHRVNVASQQIEHLPPQGGEFPVTGNGGPWMGLTPDGSPLVLRDTGTQEIYALDWEAP